MKKLVYLLVAVMCLALFSCFDDTGTTTDVWDGTIATSFAFGEGTKASPFIIKTCSQLAFMSECINLGEYTECYFLLANDLDLNGIEWTPIGTGYSAFSGSFDGNGKIIKNLNISKSANFTYYHKNGTLKYGVAGLFGICSNSVIDNLILQNANISSEMMNSGNILTMGVLCGYMKKNTPTSSENSNCIFSDIKIINANISIPNNNNDGGMVAIGGIAGYSDSYCTLDCIEVDITLNTSDRFINNNYNGGLIGGVATEGINCKNSAVYMTALCPSNELLYGTNCVGAFGYLNAIEGNVILKNIFSKIITNEENISYSFSETPARNINSIVGMMQTNNTTDIKFENLFGYVVLTGGNSELDESSYGLYKFSKDVDYTEINCKLCNELPENHGFDIDIWDVSDRSKPAIK